jgi:TatD DNase family protein
MVTYNKSFFIDAHCHLFDFFQTGTLQIEIEQAKSTSLFLCSALADDEYAWYEKLNLPNVKWYAGIHPFYEKSSEKSLSKLIELAEKKAIIGIGEIGLDKRNPDFEWQKKILLAQLDIASQFDLSVVFHTVGMDYELYKILKNMFPKIKGILHGFQASLDVAKIFYGLSLLYSIGCKFPKPDVLKFIIEQKRFCFETDAPYQKPMSSPENQNHLNNLIIPIQQVKLISNLPEEEVSIIQKENLEQLFGAL